MLLRDAQLILQRHLPELKAKVEGLGNGRTNVANRSALAGAARALNGLPSLESQAERVLGNALFGNDSTVIPDPAVAELQAALEALQASGRAIGRFLDAILPSEPECYFAASLPLRNGSSTDNVARSANSVFVALDQPVRLLGYEPLRVSLAQPGSIWFEIFGTAGAITTVGLFFKLATEWTKLKQERAKAEQEQHKASQERYRADAEREKADQERLRTQQEAKRLERELARSELEHKSFELRLESALEHVTREVASQHEAISALRVAVEQIRDLMDEGLSVRLPVDAPEEIAMSFPSSALPDRLGTTAKAFPARETKALPEAE